ncbi:unnamed protein product [Parajaminaea phylloscopi]
MSVLGAGRETASALRQDESSSLSRNQYSETPERGAISNLILGARAVPSPLSSTSYQHKQAQAPLTSLQTPSKALPRGPTSTLKGILRQPDTPASNSVQNISRGVEWGYRMTDSGDVSRISDIAASESRGDTSRSFSVSTPLDALPGDDTEADTWDSERDTDTSITASLRRADEEDAQLVEQSLPSTSAGSFRARRTRDADDDEDEDDDDSILGQARAPGLLPSAALSSETGGESNVRTQNTTDNSASTAWERDTSLDSLSLGASQTESLLPMGSPIGQGARPLWADSLSSSIGTPQPGQPSAHAAASQSPVSSFSHSFEDSLGKTPKQRSSNFHLGTPRARLPTTAAATSGDVALRGIQEVDNRHSRDSPLVDLDRTPGNRLALASRSRSVSSSSSAASKASLPHSQSTSLDASFSFNDSFLQREGAKLSQAFWDGSSQKSAVQGLPEQAVAAQPTESDAESARISRTDVSDHGDASTSMIAQTPRSTAAKRDTVRDHRSLELDEVVRQPIVASQSDMPSASPSPESESEDGVRPKETHIRTPAREKSPVVSLAHSRPEILKAEYSSDDSRDSPSRGEEGQRPDSVQGNVNEASSDSATSHLHAAARDESREHEIVTGSQERESPSSVSFTTALTTSPSADKFRRMAIAKSNAQRQLRASRDGKQESTDSSDRSDQESSKSSAHAGVGTAKMLLGSSEPGSSTMMASPRGSVIDRKEHLSHTPRMSPSAQSLSTKEIGSWSPATHFTTPVSRRGQSVGSDIASSRDGYQSSEAGSSLQRKSSMPSRSPTSGTDSPRAAVDVQTRLGAVRLALDEYMCAHSVRLSMLSERLDHSSSEASTLRELLSVELEEKSTLLREVASLKWDLEMSRQEMDRTKEMRERERAEGDRRDEELRRLVERMKMQIERRASTAGGIGSHGIDEIANLREQLDRERRMREQDKRDFEVRLMVASRATSMSPAPSRLSESPHTSFAKSGQESREDSKQLAIQSLERDHEIRVYAMQTEHDQALDAIADELEAVRTQRDDALHRLQDVTERQEEDADLRGQVDALREELQQRQSDDSRTSASSQTTDRLRQRVEDLEVQTDELRRDARAAEEQLTKEMEDRVAHLNDQLDEAQADRNHLQSIADSEREQAREAVDYAADLQERHNTLTEEFRAAQAANERTVTALEAELADARASSTQNRIELDSLRQQVEILTTEQDAVNEALRQAEKSAQTHMQELQRFKTTPQDSTLAQAAREQELTSRVTLLERDLDNSQSRQKSLQHRVESLERDVGDRGLSISKLQRANEKLELEIQDHAIALAGKQQELSLLKRKARRAGLQDVMATVNRTATVHVDFADRPHDSMDTQVLERGPVPTRAKGRRTMDVGAGVADHHAREALAPLAASRRLNVQSSSRGESADWEIDEERDAEDASSLKQSQREEADATPRSKMNASTVSRSYSRASVLRDVSGVSALGQSANTIASDAHQDEPMSLDELTEWTEQREDAGTPRAAPVPSSSKGKRAGDRPKSRTSVSSRVSSSSSTSSSKHSLSETPGVESFLARRNAANAAVQRMLAGAPAPPSEPIGERKRNDAGSSRRSMLPA